MNSINPFLPVRVAQYVGTPVSLDFEVKGALFEIYMNREHKKGVLLFAVMNDSHSWAEVVKGPVLAIELHNRHGIALAYAGGLADMINCNFAHPCPSCRGMVEGLKLDKLCKNCTEALERIQQPPKQKLPTIYEIKRENAKTGSHFFDRDTMRFFRDTMRSFRVYSDEGKIYVVRKPHRGSRETRWRFYPATGELRAENNPSR